MRTFPTGRILAALAVHAALAGAASAQSRPQSVALTCREAAALVTSRGALVLGTGGYTYDRYVRDRGFCEATQVAENAFAPTRDVAACLIGFRCAERVNRAGR